MASWQVVPVTACTPSGMVVHAGWCPRASVGSRSSTKLVVSVMAKVTALVVWKSGSPTSVRVDVAEPLVMVRNVSALAVRIDWIAGRKVMVPVGVMPRDAGLMQVPVMLVAGEYPNTPERPVMDEAAASVALVRQPWSQRSPQSYQAPRPEAG